MKKIRVGILGPSEIAFRRFLPALLNSDRFEYVGVAIANPNERNQKYENCEELNNILQKSKKKAKNFQLNFNGQIFASYEELLSADDIDAIYIPLPPKLHYVWAKKALEYNKHILLEKPFTTNLEDTKILLKLAKQKALAVHENYAFCYHEQVKQILQLLNDGEIGDLRQIRTAFGFPYRGSSDFRYNKELGGGALLDCGGYPVKLSTLLLRGESQIVAASLNISRGHDVDIFGSATLENNGGITSHISFGMDNFYKCEFEIWGSKGYLYAPRIFTAPPDLKVNLILNNGQEKVLEIPEEDQFLGSINHFYNCIKDKTTRLNTYNEIETQSKHINDILKINQSGRLNI
ncbi:putative dehydrogenase [Schinkia azotoformans MEV2011]|uniref:Putative dehydrogenase n=1 Tax=Schinkia azotoformans MEV2011 TaxID=1348973 RepID=A0A072NNP1_SCHAZ|nr:Gfo/Idh/MocA family oxidoreductase [Schinkia azotoformans]KEF38882.1 putative dehydrogenase [Schinkia azotoformans MEV2011]MEC1696786.1 Gfo/Idh/MocA family oxidoreductase [Schinkia azotoformans]MEC1725005.1 Gfo/Idh/MocA family oxidoreductase [Schinkia azotoformans]MEC1741760.1 Gfo/Idh/MocA family oxidoreductase [Schinkia azotoformans]MEC1766562.1 Gfo/Idh/MocA family oxidoreductase [Schinkia azotoformans]